MVPIMEREFVDKHHWLNHEEFMDILVVSQSIPGIFAVDMSSYIGYKLRGVWGGVVGAIGMALPSIVAIILIALFFQSMSENPWVEAFFRGVRPVVVALIAAPCFRMARTAKINRYTCWIPVVSCLLIWLLGVSPIWVIAVAGVSGYIWGRFMDQKKGGEA